MVAEVFAGLSAIKTAFDMAKGLEDIHDATIRNRAVIDLQKEILAAQSAQFSLVEQISTLKTEMAKLETWDTQKKKYELKTLGWGAFAYMLKPEARGTQPAHWVCTNCFSQEMISIIQYMHTKGSAPGFACPSCSTPLRHSGEAVVSGRPIWLD